MTEPAHVFGDTDPPLIEKTIGTLLDEVADRHGETTALVSHHQDRRLSYRGLRDRVDALACGLLEKGLQTGDRVGIWAPNCEEWALLQLATAKAGLILVNINPAYRRSELEYAINKVGCRMLVTAPRLKTSDYIAMLRDLAPELDRNEPILKAARLPSLEFLVRLGSERTRGFISFDDLLSEPSDEQRESLARIGETLKPGDPINIQFTSGTTGKPKGATLTHRNILNNGFFTVNTIGLKAGEALCVPVPLYHCFGMVMGNLGCLAHGATIVYPGESFDPLAVMRAIESERCVGLYGVPTMFLAILDHPERKNFDLTSLRTGIMAGSPCPIEVMKRVLDELGVVDITIAYGMTETSPVSFQSGKADSVERRVSTVGHVHPHCEVKVVDATGATLPRGETGELCTRGYSVMMGYWEDEAQTREAIDADGFMHTGDLAVVDDAGYGQIVGRLKDLVIRGGENIYPREVEEYLYRHPKIGDVQVIGVKDARYGEELCACIIRKDPSLTAEEVRAFCEGQISHQRIPRYVEFVDEFPLTATGKVQKFVLRDSMAERIGKEPAA